jgi:hypothetical protein
MTCESTLRTQGFRTHVVVCEETAEFVVSVQRWYLRKSPSVTSRDPQTPQNATKLHINHSYIKFRQHLL